MLRNRTIAFLAGCVTLTARTEPATDDPTSPTLGPAEDGVRPAAVRYVQTRLSDRLGAATAINSKGQVLAYAFINGDIRSFIWETGPGGDHAQSRDARWRGGQHRTRHDGSGRVVGYTQKTGGPILAFIWENGTMRRLPAAAASGEDHGRDELLPERPELVHQPRRGHGPGRLQGHLDLGQW
ncbi:MAG: hypothetical protein ACREM9_13150 [Gemmatimonadales bacterium]